MGPISYIGDTGTFDFKQVSSSARFVPPFGDFHNKWRPPWRPPLDFVSGISRPQKRDQTEKYNEKYFGLFEKFWFFKVDFFFQTFFKKIGQFLKDLKGNLANSLRILKEILEILRFFRFSILKNLKILANFFRVDRKNRNFQFFQLFFFSNVFVVIFLAGKHDRNRRRSSFWGGLQGGLNFLWN